ncbi:MAG: hypothetical protein IPJ19_18475 [Planctomycetes bacterium]|nr:hypothetical protein [Planctomycetota bacterium]
MFVLLQLGAASASAQLPPPAQRVVVTSEGAFVREAPSVSVPGGPQPMQSAGTLWTRTDGGWGWIGESVSIGNHASEVFAEPEYQSQRAELYSAFDANPPTALWSDTNLPNTDAHHVASADDAGIHVSMRVYGYASPTPYFQLSKYSSLSAGAPDWTYAFPTHVAAFSSRVAISRDGQTIVAGACNSTTSTLDIAVFHPDSNVPVSFTSMPLSGTNNFVRAFDLSADGSTLYVADYGNGPTPPLARIWDVASHSQVFSTPIGATFDSHGISGDGSVFAYGLWSQLVVWKKVAGVYTNIASHSGPGSSYIGYLDVSDDGSTIAYGTTFYLGYQQVLIECFDVASQSVTMSETVTSAVPALQNIVSGVSISADGERFAVGLWGDGSGPVAEARLYSKHQNAPIVTRNLAGSVFGLDISGDGQRAAFASHNIHANISPSGGEIDLLGDATPFTNFCFGNGSLSTACPCGNNGLLGRGCENSATTGGALLSATGGVAPDTVVLSSSSELPHAISIVLQGNSDLLNGATFGDGVRCVGGSLKRLYIHQAVNGTAVAPFAGDLSISARSAALGDPISSGQTRSYQVYYRDPAVVFCAAPAGDTFNVSNAVRVSW